MLSNIPIVDIFAGPGGLAEGFSRLENPNGSRVFKSILAAEMDKYAHKTLTLRTFYRQFEKAEIPSTYYDYICQKSDKPYNSATEDAWQSATKKVLWLELGTEDGDSVFDKNLKRELQNYSEWVLLGGPPCQAYSTIHRWKYKTESGEYNLDGDHRSRLYKEYLRIIRKFAPAVFIMENVRGLLSLGHFQQIMNDLENLESDGQRYRVHSLIVPDEMANDPRDYLVCAEKYGIPQRRHRVILLGVRDDIDATPKQLTEVPNHTTVSEALDNLPLLRSGLSKRTNTNDEWTKVISKIATNYFKPSEVQQHLSKIKSLEQGPIRTKIANNFSSEFAKLLSDEKLEYVPNHEARGHMDSDLARYFFASMFVKTNNRSPKDVDFPDELSPDHRSWKMNKFSDRFRVQQLDKPANTIVSHISKDGHSFIHPDPWQCRSLTVREAARIQTFGDNYFFEGPRTEQYKQVGNAVPPMLAQKLQKSCKTS